ncbi:phage protease, partial [Acetobacter persici]
MNIVTSIHMALPDSADNTPPEWIHLTPAGTFGGKDGRGPFTLKDPADVITRSMDMARGKIVVDINHSTHVAAARGERSDAVGWITELNAREDGIWGRVEWNGTGRQLMADHAYRGISPAIGSRPDGTVEWIEAVSLTNRPNLGVTDLHSQNQETRMDL